MAYIKIFPIKVTDKKALDYITNPDKTDEKILVSSFGCSPETADLEFALTRENAKKNGMDKGDNLAFHLIHSFKPGEVDVETAHRLGQQFADEVLKGKYEYVISTHVDKDHIHNHIIFNAASFVTNHKYVSNKRSYHKICRISNRICQENGLATSMPTEEKVKAIRKIWNIIVEPAGKPNCEFRLIRQSGPPSITRNFYRKCSWQDMKSGREKIYPSGLQSRKISLI